MVNIKILQCVAREGAPDITVVAIGKKRSESPTHIFCELEGPNH